MNRAGRYWLQSKARQQVIQSIRELHSPSVTGTCTECSRPLCDACGTDGAVIWPCATYEATVETE